MLKTIGLGFRYPQSDWLFKDLSLELAPGAGLWLSGPNGSGKSTLLKTISGELKPSEGEILSPPNSRYMPDVLNFDEQLTVQEQLKLFSVLGSRRMDFDSLGVWFEAADAPAPSTKMTQLSLGWRKRFALSLFFAEPAELLLLDEPYNGLDDDATEALDNALATCIDAGAVVLVSSHRAFAGVAVEQLKMGGS